MSNDQKATRLRDDGERMIPIFHKGTVMYAEHIGRYLTAQKIVDNKDIADIASGSGYGTKILSKNARSVIGVDIDKDSIKYAKENYSGHNIDYRIGDGKHIPIDDESLDVVVSFETIEHVEDYRFFVKEIKRILNKDGLLLISTPNAKEFTQGNHYHVHDFDLNEFTGLLKSNFRYVKKYYQATWVSAAIVPDKYIGSETESKISTYNFKPLSSDKYLYFYFLCSNRRIREKIEPINVLGGHYSAKELTEIRLLNEKNIADYKIVLKNANEEKERLLKDNNRLHRELEMINQRHKRLRSSVFFRFLRYVYYAQVKIKNMFTRRRN